MENNPAPVAPPTLTPVQPVVQKVPLIKRINKWALASLLTFLLGGALLVVIGIIYTLVLFSTASGDQLGWIILAVFILPAGVLFRFIGLVAIISLVLAIISLVKTKGKGNVLAIVMIVASAIFTLFLPRVFVGF